MAIFLLAKEIWVALAMRIPGAGAPTYPRASGGCPAAHHVLMAPSATQAHRHVTALAQADLPVHELGAELSAALRGLVPHEGSCLIGFDPVSGLRTFTTGRNALAGDPAPLVRNEAVEHDLHRFIDLACRPNPVGALGGGAPGEERSVRLHELLAEQGFSSELRLALRGRGTLWGALVLLRERGRPPFTDEEAVAVTAIAQPLTRAVKRVSVRPHGPLPPALPPGVVVVSPDDTAEAISPQAAAWFSDLYTGVRLAAGHPLPYAVLHAAAAARNRHGARADQLARVRTRSGRWLSLAACPLGGGRVAVVLQPATTDQLLPALAAWHELTPRQLDVVHLLLQARSIKQIARRLDLSPHTVEDHLKTLYRKTGTNSQQELIAALR
jgi:DNA-binding CsgD family transcriptional regulator